MKEQKRKYGFKNVKSENGSFSCHIKKDINTKLDMYCRVNGINKTLFVNELVEREMDRKFEKLKEDDSDLPEACGEF